MGSAMLKIEQIISDNTSDADVERLKEIHVSSIMRLCASHYRPEQTGIWTEGDARSFRKVLLFSPYFIVAKDNEQLKGFGSLRKNCSIWHVYVDPKFVRKGTGSDLLKKLETQIITEGL
jgi:GNAT superfamily N-acetyltransferase